MRGVRLATLLTRTTLTPDEQAAANVLHSQVVSRRREMIRLDRYFNGRQRLEHLGIAIPDELRRFETIVNIPAMAVTEPERRQSLKAFQRSGSAAADPALREAWEYNNLDSQSSLAHTDEKIYGRTFVSVSSNEDDPEHPLITVEDPVQIGAIIDNRLRRMTSALRTWTSDDSPLAAPMATMYLPDETVWMSLSGIQWEVVERDEHRLGRVPLVMFMNRPRAGRWLGRSEMADVIGLTDAIARLITNLQVAAETHAVPGKWAAGMAKGDFIDQKTGQVLPTWEAYFTSIMATSNANARFGQFQASDLANFHKSIDSMLAYCAAVLGLPTRYMGQQTVNPAAEGAIRADESRLIKNVERMNTRDGDAWSWVMGLYERIRTGDWMPGNEVRAIWQDPATPTKSQMADAIQKEYSAGLLSREGAWDEMGWDEARKDRERSYFEAEAQDPLVTGVLREMRSAQGSSGPSAPASRPGSTGSAGGVSVPLVP